MPGEIACRIAEETGMSYRWVMKYIPARYKARAGVGGPSRSLSFYESKVDYVSDVYKSKSVTHKSKVACFATADLNRLQLDGRERFVFIKNYANTNFVSLMMEKRFYQRLETIANNLGTDPETMISSALSLLVEQFKHEKVSYL